MMGDSMDRIFKMTQAALFFTAVLFAVSANADNPKLIEARYRSTYVPGGFDSNDHVQLVAEGLFSNTCYRPAPALTDIDHQNKIVHLNPQAYFYDGLCLMVMVPYNQTMELGILESGTWKVVQGPEQADLGRFSVRESMTQSADDYLYAPVLQAYFKKDANGHFVNLTGEFTTDCMKLKNVKVVVEPKVIVLQPIAEVVKKESCKVGYFPYETEVRVPNLDKGRYLLHIRSMNGNAVNSLVDAD
jgi:hypothetical protein